MTVPHNLEMMVSFRVDLSGEISCARVRIYVVAGSIFLPRNLTSA